MGTRFDRRIGTKESVHSCVPILLSMGWVKLPQLLDGLRPAVATSSPRSPHSNHRRKPLVPLDAEGIGEVVIGALAEEGRDELSGKSLRDAPGVRDAQDCPGRCMPCPRKHSRATHRPRLQHSRSRRINGKRLDGESVVILLSFGLSRRGCFVGIAG